MPPENDVGDFISQLFVTCRHGSRHMTERILQDMVHFIGVKSWFWKRVIRKPTKQLINAGNFAVQRSSSRAFSQTPTDQTIEQTLNRGTKVKGGIIGFSTSQNTVQRWMLTAHERA